MTDSVDKARLMIRKRLIMRTHRLLDAFDALAELADRSGDYSQRDIDKIAVAVLEKSEATFTKLRLGNTQTFKL